MRDCACLRVSLSVCVSLSWNDIAYIYKFVCDRLPNSASSQDLSGKSSFFNQVSCHGNIFFSFFFPAPLSHEKLFFFLNGYGYLDIGCFIKER